MHIILFVLLCIMSYLFFKVELDNDRLTNDLQNKTKEIETERNKNIEIIAQLESEIIDLRKVISERDILIKMIESEIDRIKKENKAKENEIEAKRKNNRRLEKEKNNESIKKIKSNVELLESLKNNINIIW